VFDDFALDYIDVGEAVLRVRHGGLGPAVVLLHGHPRTHVTWHRVAPLLASSYTVVCPDLRGYGESSKPATTPDHEPYSKRAMAGDVVALMRALGHERFALVGHDRGSYVALRTALDHPEAVSRLVVMDCVPIGEALRRCDATFAASWWHWFFLGQTAKPAERVINADPDAWYRAGPDSMGAEAYEDYRRAIHDPDTVHAMCEDYRAGAYADYEIDKADFEAGRKITIPMLALWGDAGIASAAATPLDTWKKWATNVTGAPVDSGHFLTEENPEVTGRLLREFFVG
jgi:haloacetate dehalogenase